MTQPFMVLARVTPTTAVAAVRQLASDLARASRDAGHLAAAPGLTESIEGVAAACGRAAIDVDVLVDAPLTEPTAARVATQLSPRLTGAQVHAALASAKPMELPAGAVPPLRFFVSTTRRAQRADAVRAPIVVIAPTSAAGDTFGSRAIAAADDRPFVVLLPEADRPEPSWVAQARQQAWHTEVWSSADPPRTLEEWLASLAPAGLLDVLRADGAARAIESLTAVLSAALEQELRTARARRALVQQATSAIAPQRAGGPAADPLADIRSRLQRLAADFARGLEARNETAFSPLVGEIWQGLDEALASLTTLEYERRARVAAASIPAEFEQHWLSLARTLIRDECLADLVAMRDLFALAQKEIEQALSAAGGPPVVVQFQFVQEERLDRLLQQHVLVQHRYSGELPRTGAFEYFMIARRYQMIAFMFLSAFGLSFLRDYREFMLPSAVLLLSLGAANVVTSVRRERAEGEVRELARAREQLRSELRRMLADVRRAWVAVVTQHMNDQPATILAQIESTVREHQARQSRQTAEERQRLQRQAQGFETIERRLQAASKARDAAANAVGQARGELRQLVVAGVRAPGGPPR